MDNFAAGTNKVAKAIADNKDAISIIGGGDSAAAVEKTGLSKISPIFPPEAGLPGILEGKILPGIDAVDDK